MTTNTAPPIQVDQAFEVAYKEPNTLPEIAVTAITAVLAIAGLMLAGASAYGVFVLRGWLQAACVGGVLLGLLLAKRFTADDRNVAGTIIALHLDLADARNTIAKRDNEIRTLHAKLAKAQRPIHVYERGKERDVVREPRNDAWHNAVMLVKDAEDYGPLKGRRQSGMPQAMQKQVNDLLARIGVVSQMGAINHLVVTRQTALAQLDALEWTEVDVPSNPEVASNLSTPLGGAGEGSDDDD